jgi:hypothetical protein
MGHGPKFLCSKVSTIILRRVIHVNFFKLVPRKLLEEETPQPRTTHAVSVSQSHCLYPVLHEGKARCTAKQHYQFRTHIVYDKFSRHRCKVRKERDGVPLTMAGAGGSERARVTALWVQPCGRRRQSWSTIGRGSGRAGGQAGRSMRSG